MVSLQIIDVVGKLAH